MTDENAAAPPPIPAPVIHQPILLTPGCHALVSIGDGTTVIPREVANKMKADLTVLFPGVKFTMINGRVDAVMLPQDQS